MASSRPPDPDPLAWVDAHLDADEAELIEALSDETVRAELQEIGLDPTRLALPGFPASPRADRPAVPARGRRLARWRPTWMYGAAALLLVGAAVIVVLRDVPAPQPATSSDATSPTDGVASTDAVGPTPAISPEAEPVSPRSAPLKIAPSVASNAPRESQQARIAAPTPSDAASEPRTQAESMAGTQATAPVREEARVAVLAAPPPPPLPSTVAPSLDAALATAETARPDAVDPAAVRAAIATLETAFLGAPPPPSAPAPAARAAPSPSRKQMAAAISKGYTALGDSARARLWADRADQYP